MTGGVAGLLLGVAGLLLGLSVAVGLLRARSLPGAEGLAGRVRA